jgi:ferredoxin--NADP+ reductase
MIEATLMTEASPAPAKPHLPDAQTVTQVTHWTDRLFSFRVTRPQACGSGRANS